MSPSERQKYVQLGSGVFKPEKTVRRVATVERDEAGNIVAIHMDDGTAKLVDRDGDGNIKTIIEVSEE